VKGVAAQTSITVQNKETGEVYENYYTDKEGSVSMVLPTTGKWSSYISDPKYFPLTQTVSPTKTTLQNNAYTYSDLLKDGKMLTIETLTFNRQGFDINAEAKFELDRLAQFIKSNNCQKVILLGHTDETGDEKLNTILSINRAASVKKYLVAKGCKPEVLITQGAQSLIKETTDDLMESRALKRKVIVQFVQ
jgi:outer membrane protein OmpA-like peptidoglycan-associated protein